MLFPRLKKLGATKQWYHSHNMVGGFEKGFLTNLGDGQGYKFVQLSNLSIAREIIPAIENELKAIKKLYGIREINVSEDIILVKIGEVFRAAKETKINAVLESIVRILDTYKVVPNEKCMECNARTFQFYYYDTAGENIPICENCALSLKHKLFQAKETFDIEEKFYLRGLFGAILFSLPGVLLWLVFSVYLERIAAAGAAVMAYLSIKGYDKFGAKFGPWRAWILLTVNIFMVAFSNYFTVGFILVTKKDVTVSQVISVLRYDPNVIKFVLQQIYLSSVVCIFFWGYLFYANYQANKFPKLLDSKRL